MGSPDLSAPLSPGELASLKAVKAGGIIPHAHQERLKQLGYIEQKLGGWKLTTAGELRIGTGR